MTLVWWHGQQTGHTQMTTSAWLHIIVGVLILVLVLWRLALRFTRGAPEVPDAHGPLVKRAGEMAHWALYALLLLIPVSGLLVWYGGVEALYRWHGSLFKALALSADPRHMSARRSGTISSSRTG